MHDLTDLEFDKQEELQKVLNKRNSLYRKRGMEKYEDKKDFGGQFKSQTSKVTTLRFSSNKFNLPNLEFMIDSLLNKPNGVYNLTYEWNDKFIIDGIESIPSEDIISKIDSALPTFCINVFLNILIKKFCSGFVRL